MAIHLDYQSLVRRLEAGSFAQLFYMDELREPNRELALDFWSSIVSTASGLGFVEVKASKYATSLEAQPERTAGYLTTWTSGTGGAQKPVRVQLSDRVRRAGSKSPKGFEERWLLTYDLGRWASISTLIHAWQNSADVVIGTSIHGHDVVDAAITHGANSLGITPSLFRKWQIDFGSQLSTMEIRQVTFGGEWASQATLDTAGSIWPNSRISHVYSTTETGDICSASDGMEGFPSSSFLKPDRNIDIRGVLVVKGIDTGDVWAQDGDRFKFMGRIGNSINVGGVNVFPSSVEDAALKVAGVDECRAFSIANALLGQVVGLDYVGDIDGRVLRALLAKELPKTSVPAQVNKVLEIPLGINGKKNRNS